MTRLKEICTTPQTHNNTTFYFQREHNIITDDENSVVCSVIESFNHLIASKLVYMNIFQGLSVPSTKHANSNTTFNFFKEEKISLPVMKTAWFAEFLTMNRYII